jgi:hypothetical protein
MIEPVPAAAGSAAFDAIVRLLPRLSTDQRRELLATLQRMNRTPAVERDVGDGNSPPFDPKILIG